METQFTEKDQLLWRIAKKRVGFKRHFAMYLVINTMFWFVWYYTDRNDNEGGFPWPVWSMLGWGIGLLFTFLEAYVFSKHDAVGKEFEKLKNKQS